ncbi:hypothetical protein [Streptacidiphilus sp. MAP5-3]|uniref:hypothetical protein n=1 Tax=unclassified Streptacidiphilus TaxID=2643834 RepID=UPI0035147E19
MSEASPEGAGHHAHVVVHPVHTEPMAGPYRPVTILGRHVGKAHVLADVAEFCRLAGLEELDLESEDMVEWQGGGPDVWA